MRVNVGGLDLEKCNANSSMLCKHNLPYGSVHLPYVDPNLASYYKPPSRVTRAYRIFSCSSEYIVIEFLLFEQYELLSLINEFKKGVG